MKEELNQLNELALSYYLSGNMKKALQLFYQALHFVDPEEDRQMEHNILINIAQIYDEVNQDKKAMTVYRWIYRRYGDPAGLYGMALIYEKNKNYGSALEYYHKAIEVDENYRDAIFFMANLYDMLGETEEAIRWYKDLIEKHPDDYMALMNLGAIYESRFQYEKAKELFCRSIDIEDGYFRSHFNLGIAYKGLGDYEKALRQYDIAKTLEPQYGDIYLNISAIYIEEEKYSSCEEILTEGIEQVPDEANLYYNRACVRLKLGKEKEAIDDGKKSVELNPEIRDYMAMDEDLEPIREEILGEF
ncbi:MAG: tetratricopeptide repeat protein [Tissierellia bacterium]|nr:tetratricopeptide repeat protein [Tissierellia bacterium]